MLNLNDLYYFVQVVDHRGFTPASRRLAVPKSTLSKRVAALESELGVRLIQRTSRSFTVTDIGRDFHRHASAMLIEAEAAENVIRGRLAEPSGSVRITASIPTAAHSLSVLLPELARTWPRIRIELHATDRFVDLAQEGFDIGVRDHFAPLPDSDLVQRRIGEEAVYLMASPAYLARCGVPALPRDLQEHEGLLMSPAASVWALQDAYGVNVDVSPRPRFIADESEVLLQAAIGGLGVTCLPQTLCQASLDAGELTRVLPEWTAGKVTTTLLMPHRRGQLPSVRAVVDFLAERLSSGDRAE